MTKTKKTLIIIFVLLLVSLLIGFLCCRDKKYDVAIKVGNSNGNEWLFTTDIDEIHCDLDYSGKKLYFGVNAYNLPKHPRWGQKWIAPTGTGANVFHVSISYGELNSDKWLYDVKYVCERGRYIVTVEAASGSDLWRPRAVNLFITVI